MKHYPKTIKVCNKVWEVKFVKEIPGDTKDELMGLTWYDEKTIYIKTGLGPRERLATFLHETMHAVQFSMGIELNRANHKWIYKMEEGFTGFFCDNFISMVGMAMSALK